MTLSRFTGESAVIALLWELEGLKQLTDKLDAEMRQGETDPCRIKELLNETNLQVQKVNLKLLTSISRVK